MREKLEQLKENLDSVIRGKKDSTELLVIALCSGGNVLMEDVPGVGKTSLAKALAMSIEGDFHRVQFTPDLLPSDIVGTSIYNPKDASFHFRKGPVFTNILLADEINRASPRTQSALLEAMNEGQVTTEGSTHLLPRPFLVVATENPIEYHGTYPLPEAQLDRFAMQFVIGYPDEDDELDILFTRRTHDPIQSIKPVICCSEICRIQDEIRNIHIENSVGRYVVGIVRATRQDPRITLGASPRALLSLSRCSQARAYLSGRDYVLPDDVKILAPYIISHRISLDQKIKFSGESKFCVVTDIVKNIEVPA